MVTPLEPGEMNDAQKARYDAYVKEFTALKAEQAQRIGFRDNMLYVTLVAVGALGTFALETRKDDAALDVRRHALLVIPWLCVILGWTYVINDEKISAIGDYIKRPGGLGDRVHELVGGDKRAIFGWEAAHASDGLRFLRKLSQLAVDLATFVASGFVAMGVFYSYRSGAAELTPGVRTLMCVEGLLLALLGAWIVKYSGVWRGRRKEGREGAAPSGAPPKDGPR